MTKTKKSILLDTKTVSAIVEGNKTQIRKTAKELLVQNTNGFNRVNIKRHINPKTNKFELYSTPNTEKSKNGLFGGSINAYNNGGLSKRTEQYLEPEYKVGDILDVHEINTPWRPFSQFKKRTNISLEVTDVRVERLQDITALDVIQEGIPGYIDPVDPYAPGAEPDPIPNTVLIEMWREFWDETSPAGYKWKDNPLVFVYEFETL